VITRLIAVVIVAAAGLVVALAVTQRRDVAGMMIAASVAAFAALSVAVLKRSGSFEPPSCSSCGGLIARSAPYCKHCGSPTDK
jgi:hypothetical protein